MNQLNPNNIKAYFGAIPKIELHLHLEGAIPLEALFTLVRKYGGDSTVPDITVLKERFVFTDFPHFLDTWVWKNQFIREYEDFEFIAAETVKDLREQNIRYAEVFYSPADHLAKGLEASEITAAIRKGLAKVSGIKINLVADLVRNTGPLIADGIFEQIRDWRDHGVIGIGLGGAEHEFPPELFAKVYQKAAEAGFHLTAHAGEASGPASIWGALRILGVERIGHGTRAGEDPALLEYLAEHRLPLEMCPVSNVQTRVVGTIDEHPIRSYFDKGILVTVNTDDPKMFGNNLAGEYYILYEKLDFSVSEINQIILDTIDASWLEKSEKQQLKAAFTHEFSENAAKFDLLNY